jgi:hypothetical protein
MVCIDVNLNQFSHKEIVLLYIGFLETNTSNPLPTPASVLDEYGKGGNVNSCF